MGTKKKAAKKRGQPAGGVASALFGQVRQRVLGALFSNPTRSFYANELIALVDSGTGSAQRELINLEAAGLVTATRVGKQKHYQANTSSPVYEELRGLMVKTSGLCDVLRIALEPLASQIKTAFVYGSIAKGSDTAHSDIDLMIISDTLTHADIFQKLETATHQLRRSVNPTIYTQQELSKRIREKNSFVKRVKQQPKLWLIGENDAFSI